MSIVIGLFAIDIWYEIASEIASVVVCSLALFAAFFFLQCIAPAACSSNSLYLCFPALVCCTGRLLLTVLAWRFWHTSFSRHSLPWYFLSMCFYPCYVAPGASLLLVFTCCMLQDPITWPLMLRPAKKCFWRYSSSASNLAHFSFGRATNC